MQERDLNIGNKESVIKLEEIQKLLLDPTDISAGGKISWNRVDYLSLIQDSRNEYCTIKCDGREGMFFDYNYLDQGRTSYFGETSEYRESWVKVFYNNWKNLVDGLSKNKTVEGEFGADIKNASSTYEDGYGYVSQSDSFSRADVRVSLGLSEDKQNINLTISTRESDQWKSIFSAIGQYKETQPSKKFLEGFKKRFNLSDLWKKKK